MKCEGYGANLSYCSDLLLALFDNKLTMRCPVCKLVAPIIYNHRRQIWETEKERDERRAGWRTLKHKVDPKLTKIAASYKEK